VQSPYLTADDQTSEELRLLWSGDGVDALLGFYYLDASAFCRSSTSCPAVPTARS